MIQASSLPTPQQTAFTSGDFSGVADVPREKGGQGQGFGPHELLEAALATCMVMTAEMAAAKRGIDLQQTHCEVRIDRSIPGNVTFHYALNFEGTLSEPEAQELREAASRCPVARTLGGAIAFTPAALASAK